jgi:hypothetical protein
VAFAIVITPALALAIAGPAGASTASRGTHATPATVQVSADSARSASVTPDATYYEYEIIDGAGLNLNASGACGLGPYDCVLPIGDSALPYFEFRNGSTYGGKDVYELYNPESNNCVDWDSSVNKFIQGDCSTGKADEDFWYNFGSSGTASSELYSVGATESFDNGSDYCLSALGTSADSEVVAYKCSDNTYDNQYWYRTVVGST